MGYNKLEEDDARDELRVALTNKADVDTMDDYDQAEEDVIDDHVDSHGIFGVLTYHKRPIFTLMIFTLVYLTNQLCRYLLISTSAGMQRDQGWGRGDGTGPELDLLFGPAFVVVYTFASIPLSLMADYYNRRNLLCACLALWSLATGLTALTRNFTELLLVRFLLAVALSPCTALCSSMLADLFPPSLRGTALSIYNLGVYVGYSFALGVGNSVVDQYGWKALYVGSGLAGIPVCLLLLLGVREPVRGAMKVRYEDGPSKDPFPPHSEDAAMVRALRKAVTVQDRRWGMRVYRKCFVGSEMVSELQALMPAKDTYPSRKAAMMLGKDLQERGYLSHVTKDHSFKDGNLFYRWRSQTARHTRRKQSFAIAAMGVPSIAVSASQVDQEVQSLSGYDLMRLFSLLRIKDRRRGLVLRKACFVGSQAVTAMVLDGMSDERVHAVRLGELALQEGHVEAADGKRNRFEDSSSRLYRMVPVDQVRSRKRAAAAAVSGAGSVEEGAGVQEQSKGNKSKNTKVQAVLQNLLVTAKYFVKEPILALLMVAGGIRFGAGYIWSAYSSLYYEVELGQTKSQVAAYLGWVPLVGGVFGVLIGGFVADSFVARVGSWSRLAIVGVSNLIATPFAIGALVLDTPLAYLCLIPKYMTSEMWMGIALAVVLELVPLRMRSTGVAVYLFMVSQIGGNLDLLVNPIENAMGGSLKQALLVMFPGMYLASAALFLVAMVAVKRREEAQKAKREGGDNGDNGDGENDGGVYDNNPAVVGRNAEDGLDYAFEDAQYLDGGDGGVDGVDGGYTAPVHMTAAAVQAPRSEEEDTRPLLGGV